MPSNWNSSWYHASSRCGGMPDGHHYEPVHACGLQGGERPGDPCAEVVADDVRAVDAEAVEDRDRVRDAVPDRVRLHGFGALRRSPPAQVGGDAAHPCGGQRLDLVAPQVRRVREAVQQEHRLPRALVAHRQFDAVASHARKYCVQIVTRVATY
jgi:hypothetical protein